MFNFFFINLYGSCLLTLKLLRLVNNARKLTDCNLSNKEFKDFSKIIQKIVRDLLHQPHISFIKND